VLTITDMQRGRRTQGHDYCHAPAPGDRVLALLGHEGWTDEPGNGPD
jgi:hypothetical protein